jgi:hypothetical protein
MLARPIEGFLLPLQACQAELVNLVITVRVRLGIDFAASGVPRGTLTEWRTVNNTVHEPQVFNNLATTLRAFVHMI